MKKIYLLFAISFLFIGLQAQSPTFKITKIGISLGVERDLVSNLSAKSLLENVSDQSAISSFESEEYYKYSGVCENPHYRLSITATPSFVKNAEVLASLLIINNRVDGVTYNAFDVNGEFAYANIDMFGDELGLELEIRKILPFAKRWTFYPGAGFNIGYHYNNEIYSWASTNQTVNDFGLGAQESVQESVFASDIQLETPFMTDPIAKVDNGFSTRAFVSLSVSRRIFKRIELGFDTRFGLGKRFYNGSSNKSTRLKSTALSLRYLLKQKEPQL